MSQEPEQKPLFENPAAWTEHWGGMPEFQQRDLMPKQTLMVHFANDDDRRAFAQLVGQTITERTKSIWYPKAEIGHFAGKAYKTSDQVSPRYPIYIVSKGRWESRLTSKALEAMNVPYRIVVEPQEFDQYANVIDPCKILVLPFGNLGQGSIPARNWIWEHAIGEGHERHWILDDNIDGFDRLYKNSKLQASDEAPFTTVESFVDRYSNVAMAGLNYRQFAKQRQVVPPFILNTRIYSCILIKNDLLHRWRGRYNEDTDLSLRILKDGWCTVLLNAFLARKEPTMTMKGGNTDELYQGNGRLLMAESLREQHPDIVTITTKWGRPQHHVNYKIFRRNKLVLREGVEIPGGINDFGMSLKVENQEEQDNSDPSEEREP